MNIEHDLMNTLYPSPPQKKTEGNLMNAHSPYIRLPKKIAWPIIIPTTLLYYHWSELGRECRVAATVNPHTTAVLLKQEHRVVIMPLQRIERLVDRKFSFCQISPI